MLVTTGNLYGYGAVDGPMSEDLPLLSNTVKGQVRAKVWAADLAAHQAGRIRTAEVRGSDYLGAAPAKVASMPTLVLRLAGLVDPSAREMVYQWQRPVRRRLDRRDCCRRHQTCTGRRRAPGNDRKGQ